MMHEDQVGDISGKWWEGFSEDLKNVFISLLIHLLSYSFIYSLNKNTERIYQLLGSWSKPWKLGVNKPIIPVLK